MIDRDLPGCDVDLPFMLVQERRPEDKYRSRAVDHAHVDPESPPFAHRLIEDHDGHLALPEHQDLHITDGGDTTRLGLVPLDLTASRLRIGRTRRVYAASRGSRVDQAGLDDADHAIAAGVSRTREHEGTEVVLPFDRSCPVLRPVKDLAGSRRRRALQVCRRFVDCCNHRCV